MDRWLTYDQVSLIPTQVSTLEHRAEADSSVQFGPLKLDLPLIAAPMPDVTNGAMANRLFELGSLGWIHRFQSSDEQEMQTFFLRGGDIEHTGAGLAIPLKWDDAKVASWYKSGFRIFCIDTANGASEMVRKTIENLKSKYPEIFIVTGNVASFETFFKLQEWGADAIRVGIAGGSVCETRTETGVYSPMASVIREIQQQRTKMIQKSLLIADGGIKTPADMCKALALGADVVMAGGIFAGTKEAPGDPINTGTHDKPQLVKLMRGAASFSVQNGKSEHVEGRETFVAYKGSVERVINRYAAGLRSSMSYMNAKTLVEYRHNVKVIEIAS